MTAAPLNRDQEGIRDPHPAELTFVAAAQVAKFKESRKPSLVPINSNELRGAEIRCTCLQDAELSDLAGSSGMAAHMGMFEVKGQVYGFMGSSPA